MKAFLLCVLFATVVGGTHVNHGFKQYRPRPGQVKPYGIVEDAINSTKVEYLCIASPPTSMKSVKNLGGLAIHRFEEYRPDVPDPLVVDALNITAPPEVADTITGTLNLQNLSIVGLRGFQLQELSVSILFFNADFLLVFPVVTVTADYDGVGVYQQTTDVFGAGTADIVVNDLEIRGSTHVNLGDPITIDSLKITITISPTSTATITGIMNDPALSEEISKYITENAPALINDHQDLISGVLSPILEGAINGILAGTPEGKA